MNSSEQPRTVRCWKTQLR